MTIRRLYRGLVLYIVFSFVLACGNKDEVKPAPVIYSISRTEGYAGAKMTIVGANFDETFPNRNIVKFGNVDAAVDSISKTELIILVPEKGSSGNISITNQGGTATGPFFKYYDVYILGTVLSNGISSIALSKNDVMEIVAVDAQPTALYVEGNDIYIAGIINNKPAYWVNKVLQTFDTPPISGVSTDIVAVDGSVYVSGYVTDGSNPRTRPIYWKDGVTNYLSDAPYLNEHANSIFVDGGIVYVTGDQGQSDFTVVGTYWTNSTPHLLLDGVNATTGKQIAVSSGKVYVMGNSGNSLAYWINDEILNVEDGATSTGLAMTLAGSDVIIGGFEQTTCCGPVATIWITGTKRPLFSEGDTRVLSLVGLKSDAFLAGVYTNTSSGLIVPFYAFNDKLIGLTNTKFNSVVEFVAN